ncbi:MAG: hypothetical protein OHK0052_25800 [Anaerolineales bacterium]
MNDQISFLPFHAVSQFMRDDYQLSVARIVLEGWDTIPEASRKTISQYTQRSLRVPGFRNAAKAPLLARLKPSTEAIGKNAAFAAAMLSAWAALHPDLMQKIYTMLTARGWKLLPLEADRTKLPGFLPRWLASEEFDILIADFRTRHPDDATSDDDICLMSVWLAGRLPYQLVEAALEEAAPPQESLSDQ